MSDTTAASYKPDMQVMTLSEHMPAFADPNDPTGFTTPEQVAIFTHEWIHYLHNVSTIVGMTTICTYANIWNSFRWTFKDDGWSHPDGAEDLTVVPAIELQFDYLRALRSAGKSVIPRSAEARLTRATGYKLEREEDLPTHLVDFISLSLEYRRNDDAEAEQHVALIKTHEILEYAAFALEEIASIKLGSVPRTPKLIPYLLVAKLAELVSPNLDKMQILKAAIACLQHPSPPGQLLRILKRVEHARLAGKDADAEVASAATELLEMQRDLAEMNLRQTESAFTYAEPMGDSVKHTMASIRRLLSYRLKNPFFEIDAIGDFKDVKSSVAKLIYAFGGPIFVQRRLGYHDQIGRDLMYNFFALDPESHEIANGWLWAHAAYRFIGAHIGEDRKIMATAKARPIACPFYTTCVCTFRETTPDLCTTKPWLSVLSGENTCEFAHAVHITRPPASDVPLRTHLAPDATQAD